MSDYQAGYREAGAAGSAGASTIVAPVRILSRRMLHGCNRYHGRTVIVQSVDLAGLAALTSSDFGADFAKHFIERFAQLHTATPLDDRRTELAAIFATPGGSAFADILLAAVLAVEAHLRFKMNRHEPVGYSGVFPADATAHCSLVWECVVPRISRGASKAAVRGVLELLPSHMACQVFLPRQEHRSFAAELKHFSLVAERQQISGNGEALAAAARQRELPCSYIGGSYLRLGHGISQRIVHESLGNIASSGAASMPATAAVPSVEVSDASPIEPLGSAPLHRILVAGDRVIAAFHVFRDGVESPTDKSNMFGADASFNDVTEIAHRDNLRMAVTAASERGMAMALVDFLSPDITRSHHEAGGAIVAINRYPMPSALAVSSPAIFQQVGKELLNIVFPRGRNGRVPVLIVAGDRGTRRVARACDRAMLLCDKVSGLALPGQSSLGGVELSHECSQKYRSAEFLLENPRTELLVTGRSMRAIVSRGLTLERCDVAAVLDPIPNGDLDAYSTGLAVVGKALRGTLVISARNKLALKRVKLHGAQRLILIGDSIEDESIRLHLGNGGIAVVSERDAGFLHAVIRHHERVIASLPLVDLRGSGNDAVTTKHTVDQMFVVGMAYAAGLSGDELRRGVGTDRASSKTR